MVGLALVTGASAGIGLELARQLAGCGYDIIGLGASDRIHQLPSKLPDVHVIPVAVDLTTDEGVENVWREVDATGRPLDVAALNAGVSLGGAFLDTDLEAELGMIALNITSQVQLAKRVVRMMADRRQGRIIITSSLSASTPTPYESIYGPTRAFMYSFSQGLRVEMHEYGVTVTALLPGATATDFHQRAGMGNTVFGSNDWKNDPALVAQLGVDALFAGKDHVNARYSSSQGDPSRTTGAPARSSERIKRVEVAHHGPPLALHRTPRTSGRNVPEDHGISSMTGARHERKAPTGYPCR